MGPLLRRYYWLLFFAAYLGVGILFLPLLTDWVSFIVDEGFTTYAAQRIREGQWPHRDFFFLWTPGTPLWHALLQALGSDWRGERASALVAAATSATLILVQARDWALGKGSQILLAIGLLAWSFALWNIPYASWYALPFVLLGARCARSRPVLSGALFALAFWFKQNMGLLGGGGAILALWIIREKKAAAACAAALAAGLAFPLLGFLVFGGTAAFTRAISQIFLFPLRYPALMGEAPPREWFAKPLMLTGLWIMALFSLQPHLTGKVPRLVRLAALLFLAFSGTVGGQEFFLGCLLFFGGVAWLFAGALAAAELSGPERERFWLLFLPAFGAFLQAFPRADFQHFLFVFPLTFFFWIWATDRLGQRYAWLKGGMIWLPAAALLWGGIFFDSRLGSLLTYGKTDRLGLVSYGWASRVNDEMAAVIDLLHEKGLRPGDPVLVLPNATTFYRISGFRNPTPHDQFFPGYVEAFGREPAEVLPAFATAGGRFLVWQYKSGLKNPPAIARQIEENYQLVTQFPEHFSVWERKPIH